MLLLHGYVKSVTANAKIISYLIDTSKAEVNYCHQNASQKLLLERYYF